MILNLIYDFLKILILGMLRVFYPHSTVFNKKRFKFKAPTIVVSNHPNTLLDAVGVAARTRQRVFFLANAGLFKNPVMGWILDHFFCIPVMRKKDVEVKKVDNDVSFQRAFSHLAHNGSMYIAPEGTSFLEHRLRPVKSGTARIALGAEAVNDWKIGVQILPVGLTYSTANRFRSRLVVNVGEPIIVSDYKADYESDSFKATKKLTALLDQKMRSLIVDTVDDVEDDFIQKLETIHLSEEKDLQKVFNQTQQNIQTFRTLSSEKSNTWLDNTNNYFQQLQSFKTSDKAVCLHQQKTLLGNILLRVLLLIVGFPLFVYGATNHLFAVGIPHLVNKKAGIYVGYHSAIKTMVGLFTFPIFYYWQYRWVGMYFSWEIALAYLLTLYPLGVLAWEYRLFFGLTRELMRFSGLGEHEQKVIFDERSNVISFIE